MAISTSNGSVAISTSNGEVAGTIGGRAVSRPQDRASTPEDLRLALRAATLYYLDGLTQAEIASRLGVSRPTAGRLVARAKAKGLVRIEVVVPPDMSDDLHADEERELEQRYGLTEAVVAGHGVDVGAPGRPAAFASVGRGAAALLMRRLSANDVLGFTWGPLEQVAVPAAKFPDKAEREAEIVRRATPWAKAFDGNSLVVLRRASVRFDAEKDFAKVKAKVLYVLSRTDKVFPPSIAPDVMAQMKAAGITADYFEIDSDFGHSASGLDAAKWAPRLKTFMADLEKRS